jgi:hypothetical protein
LNSPEFLRKTNHKGEIEPSVRGAQRMYEAMRYSFLLRLGAPWWLKIIQYFGKFQPLKSYMTLP